MTYLQQIPRSTVRETDRGYAEYVFDKPLDLTDVLLLDALTEEFETEEDMIDVRDEYTVWVWE